MLAKKGLFVFVILITVGVLTAACGGGLSSTESQEPNIPPKEGEGTPVASRNPPTLNIPHRQGGAYAYCSNCHNSGTLFKNVDLPHALDGTYASCSSCHTLAY